jgi:hypothetical protein
LDLSSDIGSLPIVGLPIETLSEFENFAASKGISDEAIMNSQRDVYVAYPVMRYLNLPFNH